MNHFERLGLPTRYDIDPAELERAYLTRSRAVHPDYHLAGSGADLTASVELSAALNDAYRTLRDPYERAEYLLTLLGGPPRTGSRPMPPDFLAEMLEARERIESARGHPDRLAALESQFVRRYDELMTTIATDFARLSSNASADRPAILARIRQTLDAAKYVRGLIRDLGST